MFAPSWLNLKSRSKVGRIRAPGSCRRFSCWSFKDIQSLFQPEPEALTPRRVSTIIHRAKTSSSAFRLWVHHVVRPSKIHDDDRRVVIYYTSLRVVHRTFEDCRIVRLIFRGYRAPVDERYLSMDTKFSEVLQESMGNRTFTLPMVFISGLCGGVEEITQLHESGDLKVMMQWLPEADAKPCDLCGGFKFVLCQTCDGSHRVHCDGGFSPCTTCNVNGLVMCPSCSTVRC